MTVESEIALLAAGSYWDIRQDRTTPTRDESNRAPIPEGWALLEEVSESGAAAGFLGSGFSARAYRNLSNGEIVISYAGTEFGTTLQGLSNDFLSGNIPLAIGKYNAQAYKAAKFFLDINAKYGGGSAFSNVTFTGHSLGGGLASLMAVWFNRPAYVFAPAPFEASADNRQSSLLSSPANVMRLVQARLLLNGYQYPSFFNYSPSRDFAVRESAVNAIAVKGELIEKTLFAFNWIERVGGRKSLFNDPPNSLSFLDKHSIDLHVAALVTPNFEAQANKLGNFLERLFDNKLYGYAVVGNQQNILVKLLRNEVGVRDDSGQNLLIASNGMLTHFSNDLAKLSPYSTQLATTALDVILSQEIEWYYWQGRDYSGQEFFSKSGEVLQYTTAVGANLGGAQNRAAAFIPKWLAPIALANGEDLARVPIQNYAQWNLNAGNSAVTAIALDSQKSQIFIGGNDTDNFTAGNLNDLIFAGDGADTISGGNGDDLLYGGLGDDHMLGGNGYDRYAIMGHDIIEDSDGRGSIQDSRDQVISGLVEKRSDGSYSYLADSSVIVTGGTDLTLAFENGDSVTIKNFRDGDLGLHLNDTGAKPVTNRTILGDLAPIDFDSVAAGIQTRTDDLGNVIVDPNQAQPNRADVLFDSAGNDTVLAFGGNDQIDAFRGGNDRLDGGAGIDIVSGRTGDDIVIGGEGADLLRGDSGTDKLYAGNEVTLEDALASQALASGLKGDFMDGGSGNDVVVGDIGNDAVNGGQGADILLGGAGNDDIDGDLETATVSLLWSITRTVTTDASGVTQYLSTYNGASFAVPVSGGDDAIYAGAGVDWVRAGYGDDYVDGGADADVLFGEGGNDNLFGDAGNDVIVGDSASTPLSDQGDDYLDGEDGDDKLFADAGNDQLFGGAGTDTLYGSSGNDYLDGEDGNDLVIGGSGDDDAFGGAGNDTLQGDSGSGIGDGNDYLDGEDGNDLIFGEGGSDEIHGGAGADRIAGDNGGSDASGMADTIFGEAGSDTIDGQGGDDFIDAGADNDLVAGGTGNDQISGGSGDDQLQAGEGDDMVEGGDGADVLFGEAGNDTLRGGAGNDYLIGGLGDDTLDGGEGDDVYYYRTGDGKDHIVDSGGTDYLVFNDINFGQVVLGVGSLKMVVPGGEVHLDDFNPDDPYAPGGIEYFQFADGVVVSKAQLISALGFAPTGTPEADVLSGTALSETIRSLAGDDVVTARAGNDVVYAEDGDDVVYAGEGNDLVYGGNGDDVLAGEEGNDVVNGESGRDLLSGGAGADTLQGGDGDDYYLFQVGDGLDTVIDAQGQNEIILGSGLTQDGVVFRRQGNDLLVDIKNTTDRLTVKDWYMADSHFASVTLGDGTVLDRAAVEGAMPRNQAPVVVADGVTVIEDSQTSAAGNALANDSDPEGRALRVTNPGTYSGTYGTLGLQANGNFTYTLANSTPVVQGLAAGQSKTELFGYSASDDDPGGATSAASTIVVTVRGSNDLPLLGSDNASTVEDTSPIRGNVLANDQDVDEGTVLTIVDPGNRSGAFGALTLSGDGSWTYSLTNNSSAVQSLAAGQTVVENFAFSVGDGIAQLGGNLAIAVGGANDAPIVFAALADQAASANSNWSWHVPGGSFTDVDSGDVLSYVATRADGTVLPSWLIFDSATQTFSGRVPKSASVPIDIRVTAKDRLGASATDVFTLSFDAANGGGGGGGGGGGNGGVGSQGNEGVGNGVDGPPPGHDGSFNDGTGTGPGHPGAQGGNGYRPPQRADMALKNVLISGVSMEQASPMSAHGNAAEAHDNAPGYVKKLEASIGNSGAGVQIVDSTNSEPANRPIAAGAAAGIASPGQIAPINWLTDAAWSHFRQSDAGLPSSSSASTVDDEASVFARWLQVQQAMAEETSKAGMLPAWLDGNGGAEFTDLLMSNGDPGSLFQQGRMNGLGLLAGARLKVFEGLGEGVQRIV